MNYLINFYYLIKKTLFVFDIYNKKYLLYFIFILSIFSSIFEILTIGSLLPLLDLIFNSSAYLNNQYFLSTMNFLGIEQKQFPALVIILFGTLLFFSYLMRIFTLWLNSFVVNDFKLTLDRKIFSNTIGKDYKYLIETNSSVLLGNMEKSDLASGAVFSLINLISSIIISTSIILFVIFLNYEIALFLTLFFFLIYLFLILTIKSKLNKISNNLSVDTNKKYKYIVECNDNIKEIKLRNLKSFFLKKIDKPFLSLRNARINFEILNFVPAQVIILIISLLILTFVYFFLNQENKDTFNFQLLGAIIFATQRILPSLQTVYTSIIGIKTSEYPLNDILKIIKSNPDETKKKDFQEFNINQYLEIKNLSFKHNENSELIFDNLNIKFEKDKIYFLTGDSGIGKTTFLDLLMGLLPPLSGELYADKILFSAYQNKFWQEKICHIPQNSLLADASILENITYGSDYENIDMEKVEEVCKKAEIDNLINNSENGINTIIGEKGLKISGGERQRLSIAKAIYSNKEIYLFDEASNAIDEETETKIFKNFKEIFKGKIVIIISHNKKNYNFCDRIYEIKNKKIEIKK